MTGFGGHGLTVAPQVNGQAVSLVVDAHAAQTLVHFALPCSEVASEAFDVHGSTVLEGGDDRAKFHAQGGIACAKSDQDFFGRRLSRFHTVRAVDDETPLRIDDDRR